MIVVERTFSVAAGPEPVMAYLQDFTHTAQWDPAARSVVRTGSGPIGPGATWQQTSRILGVTADLTYLLVTAEPGRLVLHGRNEGATSVDTVLVRPAGAGSTVTYRVELELHGLAKLATPLIKAELEKFATRSAERLTATLNALAGHVELPGTVINPAGVRGQEA